MKRILITGASGMLGASLVESWSRKYDIFATGHNDFLKNSAKKYKVYELRNKSYTELIEWANPEVIVHCAAITSGDYCENNPDKAMAVNGESVRKLLESAPDAKLIFMSTDAVFPCQTHLATEDSLTGAENIYGKSKEYGENFIRNSTGNNCIVRTTIVGKNINTHKQGFVEWIINSVKKGNHITLFYDVLFTPISIWHLANELEWVINKGAPKILHISGSEIMTKYEFGHRLCQGLGLDTSLVTAGSIDNVQVRAKRAKDQTLDSSFYMSISNSHLPTFKETIEILTKHFEGGYGGV